MIKIPKNNLVIAAVGDSSLHKHWMSNKDSDYDLALIYYGNKDGYAKDASVYTTNRGTKFHLIADLFESNPRLSEYEHVWMPDDDLIIDPASINKLFKMNKEYDLWISQPSIMGWYGLDVTLHHKNSILRYTNYVEIMCPCFQQAALQKCFKTFRENKTGWGIDSAWNIILGQPIDKIAIIDDVIAIHTRPVGGGDMYKNQVGNKSKAMEEAEAIYKKYKLGEMSYEALKSGKLVSQESFFMNYHNTIEYGRIYKQMEAGVDVSERVWPPSPMIEKFCKILRGESDVSV